MEKRFALLSYSSLDRLNASSSSSISSISPLPSFSSLSLALALALAFANRSSVNTSSPSESSKALECFDTPLFLSRGRGYDSASTYSVDSRDRRDVDAAIFLNGFLEVIFTEDCCGQVKKIFAYSIDPH